MGFDIIEFNLAHNTPSELMLAVKGLTPGQTESLALSLVWGLCEKHKIPLAKRAIVRASMRPL